ncbi:MAG: hypothetical protein ACO32O_08835, partial [Ilumatobacteraceae bacterium]
MTRRRQTVRVTKPAPDSGISPLFDAKAWKQVQGFDFRDITYHRSVDSGTVRVAFNRPEVRNAFRPQTV